MAKEAVQKCLPFSSFFCAPPTPADRRGMRRASDTPRAHYSWLPRGREARGKTQSVVTRERQGGEAKRCRQRRQRRQVGPVRRRDAGGTFPSSLPHSKFEGQLARQQEKRNRCSEFVDIRRPAAPALRPCGGRGSSALLFFFYFVPHSSSDGHRLLTTTRCTRQKSSVPFSTFAAVALRSLPGSIIIGAGLERAHRDRGCHFREELASLFCFRSPNRAAPPRKKRVSWEMATSRLLRGVVEHRATSFFPSFLS